MSIANRLLSISENIKKACLKANRPANAARLIAVSKTYPSSAIEEALAAGQVLFGENRPQEMSEKHSLLPQHIEWHLIGQLQRNKVKMIAHFVSLIHSVDSPDLLAEISKQAQKIGRIIPCLIQINISNEDQKSGMEEAEALNLLQNIDQYPAVQISGLMGIASFTEDKTQIRKEFQRLAAAKQLFAQISHPQISLQELSMGMSGDYEIAIEEGATLVRIGTAIFGSR